MIYKYKFVGNIPLISILRYSVYKLSFLSSQKDLNSLGVIL